MTIKLIVEFELSFRSSKVSLVAIDALLNLGLKIDELPKLPPSVNVEWLVKYN